LEHFFRREFEEAARHFHHAAELDTTYVQPLVWEATADIFLSEWGDAARAAGAAERHRERLLPSERAWLDYTQGILNGDFAAASQAVRRANTIAPTPLWTYMQGVLAVFTNQPGQVPELWERLDPEGEIFTGWWQYWEWPTEAYHLLGQHRRELETARRARRQYPEFLTTLSFETIALAALGRVEEVNARIDECLALPPQQRRRPAFLMLRASEELRAHGHPESADEVVQRAIRWYRTLGPEEAELEINRFDYARALYMAGDYDEAEAIFESLSGDWARTVGYKVSTPHHVSVVGAVGVVAAARGDREEAMRISQQLEDLERHPISRRPVPAWQAAIAAQLGEKERAVNLLGQALSHGLLHGPQIHSDFDFAPLQDYPPFRTLVRPKG
nr:hypothetical protein [Gemmatimonadota bacterium]NIR76678.1 hypothetical protein [Candidatus Kutchimonas denitrificans]NIS02427.1 hypothetical protein [Gemmatimonadota bacterium]NIT68331.1 hypothetical protein [Gemmatimonadota bacterium]NIU54798.1 hypothetical protein [Gemmatimonadota bacterium]